MPQSVRKKFLASVNYYMRSVGRDFTEISAETLVSEQAQTDSRMRECTSHVILEGVGPFSRSSSATGPPSIMIILLSSLFIAYSIIMSDKASHGMSPLLRILGMGEAGHVAPFSQVLESSLRTARWGVTYIEIDRPNPSRDTYTCVSSRSRSVSIPIMHVSIVSRDRWPHTARIPKTLA